MAASTVTSKGQTTIPGEIRRHLKLKAGDRVEFVVEASGKVVMVPATVDIAELKGILAPAPRRVTLEDMEAAVRKRAARR
jgi:antitoxin PrlF